MVLTSKMWKLKEHLCEEHRPFTKTCKIDLGLKHPWTGTRLGKAIEGTVLLIGCDLTTTTEEASKFCNPRELQSHLARTVSFMSKININVGNTLYI